jgi:FKBP-type peptidyl-prolyl cis-trans isomerase (trigger factor)
MCWEQTIVIKEGAVKPTKQELEDRIEQLKTEYEQKIVTELTNKQSALNKLKSLGLNDAEINSILGK